MKERPILFSAPMVRALLAGTKTQTRRVAKLTASARVKAVGSPRNWHPGDPAAVAACPYGAPGDRLWVKETWRTTRGLDHCKPTALMLGAPIEYVADQWRAGFGLREKGKTRVSLFMRRWMSRLTLEIVEIRLERLQAITEADAKAEGVTPTSRNHTAAAVAYIFGAKEFQAHKSAYATLWEKINGAGSWALNPWVWVVTFKRVD